MSFSLHRTAARAFKDFFYRTTKRLFSHAVDYDVKKTEQYNGNYDDANLYCLWFDPWFDLTGNRTRIHRLSNKNSTLSTRNH